MILFPSPICFQGDVNNTNGKILICSLNPGISKKNKKLDQWEEKVRKHKSSAEERKSLQYSEQIEIMIQYFIELYRNKITHGFYTRIAKIIAETFNLKVQKSSELYLLLQKYVVHLDIIPFYSNNFKLTPQTEISAMKPFWHRLENFILNSRVKAFILSGNQNYTLLQREQLLTDEGKVAEIRIGGRKKNTTSEIKQVKIGKKFGILTPHSSVLLENYPLIKSLRKMINLNSQIRY